MEEGIMKMETRIEKEAKTQRELELETIEGEAALKWVALQNQEVKNALASSPKFQEIEQSALSILEDKRKIPMPSMRKGYLYNFWRDENNREGLWRRTTINEYKKPHCEWDLLLDVDLLPEEAQWRALSDSDSKRHVKNPHDHWVFKGAIHAPDDNTAMVVLSLGGTDASIFREFDVNKKCFVKGGFELKESNSRVSWCNKDSLWVGTKSGQTSLTLSGNPRTVKLWKRGQTLDEAKVIYEGNIKDVSVYARSQHRPEGSYHYIKRVINSFENEYLMINQQDLSLTPVPLPTHARIEDFINNQIIVSLNKDWNVPNGPQYKAGSVIALNLSSINTPDQLKTSLIFEPTAACFVNSVCTTKNTVMISALNNVCGELYQYKFIDDKWIKTQLPLPELGDVSVVSAEDDSDNCLLTYTNFLTPQTLYYFDSDKNALELLKAATSYFDAKNSEVVQAFSTSKDGTQIPYFIIKAKNIRYDGSNPTLLYGYGGFQLSQLPSYLSTVGKLWVEQGGVFVMSNIRGGSEFGPKWHQAALKEHRHKAFEDFISIAEDLIAKKITSPAHLGISGGSSGGLLVGAAMTQRPELFNAVLCRTPLLDMLNYHTLMLAGKSKSWMDELGDPNDPKMKEILKSYSPYHNLTQDKHYPKAFFSTYKKDRDIHPGHARKMVDKMKSLGHPVYYYENTEGGHGGVAYYKQEAFRIALEYSYLKQQLMENKLSLSLDPAATEKHTLSPIQTKQPVVEPIVFSEKSPEVIKPTMRDNDEGMIIPEIAANELLSSSPKNSYLNMQKHLAIETVKLKTEEKPREEKVQVKDNATPLQKVLIEKSQVKTDKEMKITELISAQNTIKIKEKSQEKTQEKPRVKENIKSQKNILVNEKQQDKAPWSTENILAFVGGAALIGLFAYNSYKSTDSNNADVNKYFKYK